MQWKQRENVTVTELKLVSPPHRAGKQTVVVTQAHTHQPLLLAQRQNVYIHEIS